ncbi:pterin-4a-carbinolamine dehydratase [Ammoniphilus resinae]|uniref:Pterin-4a-carbinolamine dehydratase n=1 Tax=Ammoniphilus resinae TaxID=861532 RepID=A0ABS4GWI3_9BACL|nr:pterin-4a-carbinolamine dehydratase [Ammoniphilus resinae]
MSKLTEEEILKRLLQLKDWQLEGKKWIIKKYRFNNF